MRRLTGLLTSLLLLHLTMVGPDFACATHGVNGASHASQSDASSHVDHHAPASSDGTSYDDSSCDVPILPACCQALASCSVSIAENPSAEADDLSHLADGVLAGTDDAPLSWTLEPDSPPPKT